MLNIVPMLYIRTVFIHPVWNSLNVLISDSQSFPLPPPLPLGNHKSDSISVSLVLLCRYVHLCHILDSMCKWYHMYLSFSFWLTSLRMIISAANGIQFSSVAQLCPSLCDPMDCSTPGLPVHHQLQESTETHVHRVSDAIQPSHPLSYPSPPAPNPSQHQELRLTFLRLWSEHCAVMSDSLWPHGPYSSWNFPGQNTAVGSLPLLQGIFLTQGSNPGLLHRRQILYQLSHKGSPFYGWVVFSSLSIHLSIDI